MLSTKTLLRIVAVVFSVVGLIHLLRFLTGIQVIFGGWELPMWVSIIGVLLPWYLAYNALMLSKKKFKK